MNKSFIKGLLAGIGSILAVIIMGIFVAGCAMQKAGTAYDYTSPTRRPDRVTIGTPTPVAEVGNEKNDSSSGNEPTAAPTVTEKAETPENQGTEAAEVTITPEPTATPSPEPTRNVSYDISRDLLSPDFTDKLMLLGQLIEAYYYKPVAVEDLQEGLYKGIMDAIGDPYTCYYTPKEYAELMESTSGTYCGIGAYVSQNMKTNVITITRPFVDGPAYKAGVKAGDIITKVNDTDVSSMDLSSVVAMMKGPENTKVTVTVYRESLGDYMDIVITRGFIDVPTVESEMLDNNIGYIAVTSFDEVTEDQFKKAIDDMTAKGMKSLIIDLRDNGGGLLNTCINMVDYILEDDKLIVYTEDRDKRGDKFYSRDGHSVDVPIVVLVNQYSASASEVFTGALKDHEKVVVMGVTSFGKGIVQSVIPLTDGSGLKLTTSSYFGPKGVCVQGIGIDPDIVVEYDSTSETDNQKQAAIEYLLK